MTTSYNTSLAQNTPEQLEGVDSETAFQFAALMSNTIGFNLNRIGVNSAIRAAHQALASFKALTTESLTTESLWNQMINSAQCRQLFIESIVVSESWLFREPKVFQHINSTVCHRLKTQSKVTILSAPCATGEEACSIALSLLESGHSQTQFRIIATDISQLAIRQARSGIFTENALRTVDEARRRRWFSSTPHGWEVAAKVQKTVDFVNLNLLATDAAQKLRQLATGQFDLICCRNLLIYLTKPARKKLIHLLESLLKPGGELVVGAVEPVILPASDWEPTGPLTFSRHKRSPTPQVQQEQTPDTRHGVSSRAQENLHGLAARTSTMGSAKTALAPTVSRKIIQEVEACANAGDIATAIQLCRQSLRGDGTQTDLLYTLAMLHQTMGDFKISQKFLEKAVYLEPRHQGALLSLALIAKQQGDTVAERRYRRSASLAGTDS
ncbi:MAG: methyltransferase domain-containing protein [Planctomycetaceae bacterium]|jgi:chemotaxis protein methyltransferase WspC|nr:methyltransferase domain-containing protein [Planctomycetaceae bacterium]